jgi:FAD:protein FMN transferase
MHLGAVLSLIITIGGPARAEDALRTYTSQREDVLGTSFRLVTLCATEEEAARAERAALDAVESLRACFSTWEPSSELARINARPWTERRDLEVSPALGALLKQAHRWHARTGGAFDVYLGELKALWRAAERTGQEPPASELARLVDAARSGPGFSVARRLVGARSVELLTCTREGTFDVDAIAKGAVIDQALQAAVRAAPLRGALLAIGGDLRAWGDADASRSPWTLDVVDPREPADNAPPLCRIAVRDRGVASSGGYARPLKVGGAKRSHLLDPRTGRPAEGVLGATAVAEDAATADALATALCVLGPVEGLRVAAAVGAECLLVDAQGKQHASPGWAKLAPRAPAQAWPTGFRVDLELTLVNSTPGGRGFKRHYLAAWVEDEAGAPVRFLALWANGRELKYVRKLSDFWDAWRRSGGEDEPDAVAATTRATRLPGHYTLTWDGADEAGRPLPRGRYRLRLEVNREHGPGRERPTSTTLALECGADAITVTAPDQPELAGVSARYGPRQ